MEVNLELFRVLLIKVMRSNLAINHPLAFDSTTISGDYTDTQIRYHLWLLIDGGFLLSYDGNSHYPCVDNHGILTYHLCGPLTYKGQVYAKMAEEFPGLFNIGFFFNNYPWIPGAGLGLVAIIISIYLQYH
jgi:hypothetical protein